MNPSKYAMIRALEKNYAKNRYRFLLFAFSVFAFFTISVAVSEPGPSEYTFEGYGWGHGIGMCQYGAKAMADSGSDFNSILTHYYQGTYTAHHPCPSTIRVGLLDGVSEVEIAIDAGTIFFYTHNDGMIPNSIGHHGQSWRVRSSGHGSTSIIGPDGAVLNGLNYGNSEDPLQIGFLSESGIVRLPTNGNRRYSHLPMYFSPFHGQSGWALRTILPLDFETYIKGLAEMPSSWHLEALKSQAVAARSYAIVNTGKHSSAGYDICDETCCQYYRGHDSEIQQRWAQAVDETANIVLKHGDRICYTFYSACCGGHTDNNEDVWRGSPLPYLRGVDCICDTMEDNPHSHWEKTMSKEDIESRLNSSETTRIGSLVSIDLSDKTPSGRIRNAVITGTERTVTLTGESIRGRFSLKSSKFHKKGFVAHENFNTYILIANPNESDAVVDILMTAEEETVAERRELPPFSRDTVHVNDHVPDSEVSITVKSNVEIVAERAMYFNYMSDIKGGSNCLGVAELSNEVYFAEGYTGGGFDTWLLVYNPGEESANVVFDLHRDDGFSKEIEMEIPARSRSTLSVDTLKNFGASSFSTRISSDIPIVAERAMYFNQDGISGGHAVSGIQQPHYEWNFAEGYTGKGFDTWLLLQNPNDIEAKVGVCYWGNSGLLKSTSITIDAKSRYTIHANNEVPFSEFSVSIESDIPICAERSVYFDNKGIRGGHCGVGIPEGRNSLFCAEGYTDESFETWILILNPNDEDASVELKYMLPGGDNVEESVSVGANTRKSVFLNKSVPSKEVSTLISSDMPIIAERAMYFIYRDRDGGHLSQACDNASLIWYFAEGYTGK